MHTYELYVNDSLCDLSDDSSITLLFQSPIFSELDAIQSNRSYEICLPLTNRNRAIFGNSDRADVYSRHPYTKMPARLYMDGVTLFDSGYAVITSIDEAVNIVLTWGNVDNFQPLFDEDLADLDFGDDSFVVWNRGSQMRVANQIESVGFMPVSFIKGGSAKPFSDMQYVHPSIYVRRILQAIEERHGITIEQKERLCKDTDGNDLVIPLSRLEQGEFTITVDETIYLGALFGYTGVPTLVGSSSIAYDGEDDNGALKTYRFEWPKEIDTLYIASGGEDAIGVTHNGVSELPLGLRFDIELYALDDNGAPMPNPRILTRAFNYKNEGNTQRFYGETAIPLSGEGSNGFILQLSAYNDDIEFIKGSRLYISSRPISFYDSTDDATSRNSGRFYAAPNLPDMSQGEFINQLLKLAGLFAYPDTAEVDTIKLLSVDDIMKADIVDWSSRIVAAHSDDAARPEISEFSNDDFGQRNTLDYDNDDDVQIRTLGVINIDDETLEKEKELVELEFSASMNKYYQDTGAGIYSATMALVPIYEIDEDGKGNFSDVNPRILSTDNFGIVARFPSCLRFGGDDGIVARRYASYAKILQNYRMVTVQMRLSPVDLANVSFKNRIYIGCFGQLYALYSIETSDTDVCEVKLLQLTD